MRRRFSCTRTAPWEMPSWSAMQAAAATCSCWALCRSRQRIRWVVAAYRGLLGAGYSSLKTHTHISCLTQCSIGSIQLHPSSSAKFCVHIKASQSHAAHPRQELHFTTNTFSHATTSALCEFPHIIMELIPRKMHPNLLLLCRWCSWHVTLQ